MSDLARAALLFALAAALAACTSAMPRRGAATSWSQSRIDLQQRADYQWSGRVAVAAGDEGFSSGIAWNQQSADVHLTLSGPLGVLAQLDYVGGEMRYADRDGHSFAGAEAQQALTKLLGFDLPFSSLRYWLLGVDDPATPAQTTFDEWQRPAILAQRGWTLRYAAWRVERGQWLPERLVLERDRLRVKVLISRWVL